MCDCAPGFVKITSLGPGFAPPASQINENATCYAARMNAYYKNKSAFDSDIAAHLDPSCSECVDSTAGTSAYINMGLAEAQASVDYWNCRAKLG